MDIKETCFIFSVFDDQQPDEENQAVHEGLLQVLPLVSGVRIKPLVGSYKGKVEQSLLVVGESYHDSVRGVCEVNNQESYIELDPNRLAILHYLDGRPSEELGKWREVTDVSGLDGWTMDPSTDKYYVAGE